MLRAAMSSTLLDAVTAGQTRFRLPGLTSDGRGIAHGREALIVVESLDRVVAFLGAYSEEASLDDLVPSLTIERAGREGGGQAFLLRCSVSDGYQLDRYLRLASAVRGVCMTGAASIYVRGRDRTAPFGYDLAVRATELGRASPQHVVAVDRSVATQYLIRERVDPIELIQRLDLRLSPLPLGGVGEDPELCGLREMALILVAPGLAERVLTYLWRQEWPFAGVRLSLEDDTRESLLLRVRQPSVRLIEVLRPLPGVEIFAPVSPRAAVQLGYRHPLQLSSANTCLPGDEMYLFRGRVSRVERIDGAPRFVDGRFLVRTEAKARLNEIAGTQPADLHPLKVELRLRAAASNREPRATLIRWNQAELLRKLVYLVPPSTLAASRLAALEEGLLVVTGGAVGRGQGQTLANLLPIGKRLVEVAPGILVPDGLELWPRVRPALMRTLLGLEGEDVAVYTSATSTGLRIRADKLSPLDVAVMGQFSLTDAQTVMPDLRPQEAPRIENERVGRFALWGIRSE